MTSHVKRLITALVALPFLVFIIYFAPFWAFIMLILFVALISLSEFYSMVKPRAENKIIFVNYLLTALLFLSLLLGNSLFVAVFPFFVMFPLTFYIFDYSRNNKSKGNMGQTIMGPFYICLPLILFIMIGVMPQGRYWVTFLLAVIFAGDTGSFYAGKFLGRHKLTPLSPGKTWEGAIGGLIANALCAAAFGYAIFPSLPGTTILILGIGVGLSGQIGDTAESMLKRMSNIKDSGKILPGHGGILDRIDSLLFAIPVLYIYLSYRDLSGL